MYVGSTVLTLPGDAVPVIIRLYSIWLYSTLIFLCMYLFFYLPAFYTAIEILKPALNFCFNINWEEGINSERAFKSTPSGLSVYYKCVYSSIACWIRYLYNLRQVCPHSEAQLVEHPSRVRVLRVIPMTFKIVSCFLTSNIIKIELKVFWTLHRVHSDCSVEEYDIAAGSMCFSLPS